ncbi:CsgG/HfaB family protein [Thermodesulfobacteriota bacterium]
MRTSGLILFIALFAISGLSWEYAGAADQTSKTLAILPFENNSITDPGRFEPLTKGLSAMLITDLNNSQNILRVIERNKIQALLKEIALSQSGSVDQSTAIQAGKILGAQSIAFGSFMVMGEMVRIDTRIIKVETGELIMAESITGDTQGFLNLEKKLAKKIAVSLGALRKESVSSDSDNGVSGSKSESKQKGLNPALLYSMGLDAMDRGDKEEARRLFKECISLDPTFKNWVDDVKGLEL